MPRFVSFLVLLAIALLVGLIFFKVMAQFLVPLFLAAVLTVIFQPLHKWLLAKVPKRPRLAAFSTTIVIVLLVLLPTVLLVWKTSVECQRLLQSTNGNEAASADEADSPTANNLSPAAPAAVDAAPNSSQDVLSKRVDELVKATTDKIEEYTNIRFEKAQLETFALDTAKAVGGIAGNWVLSGVQAIFGILVGLVIMTVALYYFFADGPSMIHALIELSPLDRRYEFELLAKFSEVSRSVVVATMLSAVCQGVLAGIGYYFALPSDSPIFLLTTITMVASIVPFVGATIIWLPICFVIGLLFGDWRAAIGLAIYCGLVVSMIDNLVKPMILHGHSNLHPLLALLSILGGASVLGPVGILVGPMLVSFLQVLLTMLRRELERWDDPTRRSMLKLSPAAAALAETIEAAGEAAEEEMKAQQVKEQPAKSPRVKTRKSANVKKK